MRMSVEATVLAPESELPRALTGVLLTSGMARVSATALAVAQTLFRCMIGPFVVG